MPVSAPDFTVKPPFSPKPYGTLNLFFSFPRYHIVPCQSAGQSSHACTWLPAIIHQDMCHAHSAPGRDSAAQRLHLHTRRRTWQSVLSCIDSSGESFQYESSHKARLKTKKLTRMVRSVRLAACTEDGAAVLSLQEVGECESAQATRFAYSPHRKLVDCPKASFIRMPRTPHPKLKSARHSQATLTSGMLGFEGGAYPSLNLKAWNSRLFVVYFEIVLRELVDSGAGADEELLHKELKLASAATTAMCAFLHGMESSPRYLTDEQCRFMHDSMQAFLELYEVLIGTSNARGTARWKAVPKHHSAWHLVEEMDRTHYNVRFYHSFADEDYIGQWKSLVQSVPKDLLEYRCLTRYLLRLGTQSRIQGL